jgi:5-methylcytosine-specific restriction protein A
MSRSVPIWSGKTDDAAIPKAVRLRIWAREGGRCSISGRKIMAGEPFDFEHRIPLSMGGKHDELNLCLALRSEHRKKTAAEAGPRAKADRIHLKHIGQWPASKTPLRSRNSFARRGA